MKFIVLTLFGRDSDVSLTQPANAPAPIISKLEPRVRFAKSLQLFNA